MDRNFLLFMAVSMAILVMWQGLFAPDPAEVPPAGTPPPVTRPPGTADEAPLPEDGMTGPATAQDVRPAPAADLATPARPPVAEAVPVQRVTVRNDLWQAVFTSRGGGLESFTLREYQDASTEGDPDVELVTTSEQWPLALATPLKGLGLGNLAQLDYQIDRPDADTIVFERTVGGITVRKTYRFDRDRYLFRLRIDVENGTDHTIRPHFNTLWPARARESDDFRQFNLGAYAAGDLETFVVVPPPALFFSSSGSSETLEVPSDVEWAGAHSHYFLAALLPDNPREAQAQLTPVEVDAEGLVQVSFAAADVPPGQRLDREFKVYVGPKEVDRLDAIGSHLDEAVLKGWVPSLTRFFSWLIQAAHEFVPNYGVAIILITIVVRLLMAPLMTRQMKSMKRISAMQPEIKEAQAKYPDDRQKQSEAMMSVYKKHGLSPFSMFSGCLPMVLQLPIFVGFYYALQGSIVLRQQPFIGWITDLSQPEMLFTLPGTDVPVRVLPLLMGGAMFMQQKLSPQTAMDPAQARMMLWMMPIMFTALFYQFASGLVLYWFVSTLIGIGQQWITNRSKD